LQEKEEEEGAADGNSKYFLAKLFYCQELFNLNGFTAKPCVCT
jgi:hypothetical protein